MSIFLVYLTVLTVIFYRLRSDHQKTYCSLPCAVIGAFDVALKRWKILRYPPFDDAKNWLMYDYLIDSGSSNNNNLLIVIA